MCWQSWGGQKIHVELESLRLKFLFTICFLSFCVGFWAAFVSGLLHSVSLHSVISSCVGVFALVSGLPFFWVAAYIALVCILWFLPALVSGLRFFLGCCIHSVGLHSVISSYVGVFWFSTLVSTLCLFLGCWIVFSRGNLSLRNSSSIWIFLIRLSYASHGNRVFKTQFAIVKSSLTDSSCWIPK